MLELPSALIVMALVFSFMMRAIDFALASAIALMQQESEYTMKMARWVPISELTISYKDQAHPYALKVKDMEVKSKVGTCKHIREGPCSSQCSLRVVASRYCVSLISNRSCFYLIRMA